MNRQPLKIKALNGLQLAVGCNKMLRLLEVLYTIKAIWVDRPMPDSPAAYQELAGALGLCPRHVRDRMIPELQQKEFIRSHQMRGHDPISWDDLRTMFNIKHDHTYNITFTPMGKKGQKLRLWKILYTKVKKEKKGQCYSAFTHRANNNQFIKEVLNEVAGSVYNARAVANHQLRCFINEGKYYTDDERYVLSTYFTDKDDKILRGDLELNKRSWRKIHGYKGYGSVTYMDRQCEQLGLMRTHKRQHPITGHNTRASRYNNRQGFVKYDPATSQLWLIQCDAVEILPLKGLEERIQRLRPYVAPAPDAIRSARVKKSHLTRKIKQHEAKAAA